MEYRRAASLITLRRVQEEAEASRAGVLGVDAATHLETLKVRGRPAIQISLKARGVGAVFLFKVASIPALRAAFLGAAPKTELDQ